MDWLIRPEHSGDEGTIRRLTTEAFASVEYSDGSEPAIVDALRRAGDLSISLVAELDREIVGHIAFSPVTIDREHDQWFGLGPVSVAPEKQGRGIGSSLVSAGLEQLKALQAKGCVLVGDPEFYHRFGFFSDNRLVYPGIDAPYVQQLVLSGDKKVGTIKYCEAFESEIRKT